MSLKGLLGLVVVYILAAFFTVPIAIITAIYVMFFSTRFIHQKHRIHQLHRLQEDYDHGFLDLHDGTIRIHYVEAGDRHRPLLLLVHGFPEFWYSWHHQIREFQKDYHVVAIDLRGYGDSSKPDGVGAYHMSNLVEDINQIITALGKPKCFLVGHDWGASIAWRFAIKHPEKVQKLIVMNCPHPKATESLSFGAKFKQMMRTWYMFFFQCPSLPEKLLHANDMELLIKLIKNPPEGVTDPNAFTHEDEEAWKFVFGQHGAMTPPVNYYRANIGRLPPSEIDGDIVQPPTLIVWGTHDVVLPVELANASLQFCRQGSLRVLEGVSHWTQFDRPTLCNDTIREFISS